MTNDDAALDRCWIRVGVWGDRSCKALATVDHCHHCGVFGDAACRLLDRPIPDGHAPPDLGLARETSEGRAREETSVVVFDLGNERLAIDSTNVAKAVEPRAVSRVPKRSNAVFLGLVNVDGQLELCVSLHALLGITAPPSVPASARRMVMLHADGERWVASVDAIVDVRRVGDAAFGPAPATTGREGPRLVDRVLRDGGDTIGHLDVHALVGALDGYVR